MKCPECDYEIEMGPLSAVDIETGEITFQEEVASCKQCGWDILIIVMEPIDVP